MFKYIVVGAGLSGAVVAERIASQLNEKVLVVDRKPHIAGTCFDIKDENGILVHRYGGHLFRTENEVVWSYLSQFTDWHYYQHRVLAWVDGKMVPLPFNFNSMDMVFPAELASKIKEKLLNAYGLNTKVHVTKLIQSDDEDLRFLGEYVYEKVFIHYTLKQWGRRPEEMEPEATINVPVLVGKDDRYYTARFQGVPKQGYTQMVQRMLSHKNIKLMLNTDFLELAEVKADGIYIMGKKYDGTIIYTGSLDELFGYRFGRLPFRSLDFRFETHDVEYYQGAATVHYPNSYDFTRIIEFKHIHPVDIKRTTICFEYPKEYTTENDERYYPVLTKESKATWLKYADLAREYHVIPLGRVGEFKYYNMSEAVESALRAFNDIAK